MSLADELLADPDFITSRDEGAEDVESDEDLMKDLEESEEEHMEEDDDSEGGTERPQFSQVEMRHVMDVKKVAKLLGSRQMRDVLSVCLHIICVCVCMCVYILIKL